MISVEISMDPESQFKLLDPNCSRTNRDPDYRIQALAEAMALFKDLDNPFSTEWFLKPVYYSLSGKWWGREDIIDWIKYLEELPDNFIRIADDWFNTLEAETERTAEEWERYLDEAYYEI